MRTLWGSEARSAGVGVNMSLTSPHREAAADVQRLARDIRGVLAGEEGDRGGDLLGLSRAAQGGRVDHRRLQALAQLAEHRRSGVELGSATSIAQAKPSSSPATSRAPCSLRSATATRAPSAARRRAVAAPMPDAPPVTSAVFPSRRTHRSLYSPGVRSSSTTPVAVIGASGSLGFGMAL